MADDLPSDLPPLPPLPVLLPRAPMESIENPVQIAGTDQCVNRATIGGPSSSQDIRFLVSVSILSLLLNVAKRSTTQRVVIYEAGFDITTWSVDGHLFQTMTITGRIPVPESPVVIGLQQEQPSEETFSEPDRPAHPGWSKLRHRRLGGAGEPIRLMLSASLLEGVLGRAQASRTNRAVIHRAGLVLDTYQPDPGRGGPYQIVTVMGLSPQPEDPAIISASR